VRAAYDLFFYASFFHARKEIGMNCANHPETAAVAYCQYCGKPLCDQCAHKVNNIVSCEPCLAARVHAAGTGTYGVHINTPGFQYTAAGPLPPNTDGRPIGHEPWLAFLLGLIPGVGAIYNGQIAKGLAHVVIFALLVDLSHYNGVIGVVVAAWIFYQAFDAYHTAAARREGRPLPNPLGLNDIGRWFGARAQAPHPGWNPANPNAGVAGAANEAPSYPNPGQVSPMGGAPASEPGVPIAGFAPEFGAPPYPHPPIPPVPPAPPDPYNNFWCSRGRGIPMGALILIILGVAFLLGNLGVLSGYWLERGWPLLLIAIGVWMVIRHSQTPPGVPPAGGVR
jgi:TM2 domain-containing membrane protein YozV